MGYSIKLQDHIDDVKWNLQRIYRMRNKIVHSASTKLNLIQLDANLTYYYTTLLNNVLYTCIHSDSVSNLETVYLKFESVYEFLIARIKQNKLDDEIISVL